MNTSNSEDSIKEIKTKEGTYKLISQLQLSTNNNPIYSQNLTCSMINVKFKHYKQRSYSGLSLFSSNVAKDVNDEKTTLTKPTLKQSLTEKNKIPINKNMVTSPRLPPLSNVRRISLNENKIDSKFSVLIPPIRRRSKTTNLLKTKSSLIQKIVAHNKLAEILSKQLDEETYLFYQLKEQFYWTKLDNTILSTIHFLKAFPTCHDINQLTKSAAQIDVLIGLSTGDIVLFDPLGSRYSRFNKQSASMKSAVTFIKWLPGSESEFVAAFQNGIVMMYDKDKQDGIVQQTDHELIEEMEDFKALDISSSDEKNNTNPKKCWKVGRRAITAISFSPDFNNAAIASLDGKLRVIDYRSQRLTKILNSTFGGILCVSWSPDAKLLVSGGQDDLILIWSSDFQLLAVCHGHCSWVTYLSFDPWKCDDSHYRFGSIAEDCKLALWDFKMIDHK